ncbi:MAG: DUF4834 family protein [Chitinophagaceae bacterium]|nr:MAG: DUF4834 family protein [Chitinophagaceae bacterium]
METASFYNFLRTVCYIIFFWYAFRFLFRLLFPVLVKKVVSNAQEKFRDQYQSQQQQDFSRRSDGDISIDDSAAKPSREKKKIGEYIDFEEIK